MPNITEKLKEYKVIHFHVYDPKNSIFKASKNDKAKSFIISCCNSENCELYKRGECSYRNTFDWNRCPYGKYEENTGYTKQARAYYSWITEQKNKYKENPTINASTQKMAIVGDYIYLPYSFMTMNENIPFLVHSSFLGKSNCFLPKEYFNEETILKLINFNPQALFGGDITSYQKEVIPKFIKHLSEQDPILFNKCCVKDSFIKEVLFKISNVGRVAVLTSINPNIGIFIDIYKGEWKWDGEWLISTNSHASFMLVDTFNELRIKPKTDAKVKINSEDQVNKNTIFID